MTLSQKAALLEYAGVVASPYISPVTTYWLQGKGLIERSESGKWVLTHRGRCAADSGYIPT